MQKNKISFGSLFFFAISCVVGAGLFMSPAKAYSLGSYHVIWITFVASFFATIIALCFAEMGGRFTTKGGVYIYAKEAFGKGLAFNIGLIRFIAIALDLATQGAGIGTLIQELNPICGTIHWVIIIGGIFCLILFIINYIGVFSTVFTTIFIESCVLGTLIIFIVTGIFHIHTANFASTLVDQNGVVGAGSFSFGIFANTFIVLFYAFIGFENIGIGAKDIDNPQKNIPKVIKLMMTFVSLMAFFIYFNLVGILGKDLASASNGIGIAAATYFGNFAKIFVMIVCIGAIFGIGLSQMFAGTRTLSVIAEDNFFHPIMTQKNKYGVSVYSLGVLALLAFFFIIIASFCSHDVFVLLLSCTTIGRLLQYIVISLGILKLRKNQGDSPGYKLKYAKILVPLVVFVAFAVIFLGGGKAFYAILIFVIISLLIYFLYSKPRESRFSK